MAKSSISLRTYLTDKGLKLDFVFFSGFHVESFALVFVADLHFAVEVGMDQGFDKFAILPFLIYSVTAPCSQSFYVS